MTGAKEEARSDDSAGPAASPVFAASASPAASNPVACEPCAAGSASLENAL